MAIDSSMQFILQCDNYIYCYSSTLIFTLPTNYFSEQIAVNKYKVDHTLHISEGPEAAKNRFLNI